MNHPAFFPSLLLLAACGEVPSVPEAPRPTAMDPARAEALLASPPPESDLPPLTSGTWSLACGAALELEPAGGLQLVERAGLRPVGGQAVGRPALDSQARRIAWSHAPVMQPETVVSAMSCDGDAWGEPRTLVEGPGSPDRVAISPDGAWVVWFSGRSGVASLWAVPFEGGDPVQLTNAGLGRPALAKAGGAPGPTYHASPGHPPAGFVPPPHMGDPTVELLEPGRYRVRWEAPDGEHSVELP